MRAMPSLCNSCAHLYDDGTSCEAFPQGIPDRFINDGADHRQPVNGDHGIQYKLREGEKAAYQAWVDFNRLRQDKP